MRLHYYLIFLLLITSCGKDAQEEVDSAILSATNALSTSDCDSALNSLGSVSYQNKNYEYIKLFAAANACKAGYKTTTFFDNDLSKISGTSLLSSFTTFSLAQTSTGTTDANYQYLQTAIDALLYAGGLSTSSNPESDLREQVFSSSEVAEMNSLLLYLLMNQLGNYFYYYGNTNSTGVKGGGNIQPGQVCLHSYNVDGGVIDLVISTYLAGNGGSCTAAGLAGSSQLNSGGDIDTEKACNGIVLFNSLYDTFLNITVSSIGDTDVTAAFDSVKSIIDSPPGGVGFTDSSILTVKSQNLCETSFASNNEDLQIFFAVIFESLHNRQ